MTKKRGTSQNSQIYNVIRNVSESKIESKEEKKKTKDTIIKDVNDKER